MRLILFILISATAFQASAGFGPTPNISCEFNKGRMSPAIIFYLNAGINPMAQTKLGVSEQSIIIDQGDFRVDREVGFSVNAISDSAKCQFRLKSENFEITINTTNFVPGDSEKRIQASASADPSIAPVLIYCSVDDRLIKTFEKSGCNGTNFPAYF